MRLVSAVAQTLDVVIIDTPPLMVTTEALEFVPDAKVVVLIGRVGRTTAGAAQRAGELIRFGGAEQVAVALSDTGTSHLRRASYYDYYSGNRTPRRRRRRPESRPATPASDSPSVDASPSLAPWTSQAPDGQEDWTGADELVPREPVIVACARQCRRRRRIDLDCDLPRRRWCTPSMPGVTRTGWCWCSCRC